jgi:hypothetical protein
MCRLSRSVTILSCCGHSLLPWVTFPPSKATSSKHLALTSTSSSNTQNMPNSNQEDDDMDIDSIYGTITPEELQELDAIEADMSLTK